MIAPPCADTYFYLNNFYNDKIYNLNGNAIE